VSDSFEDALKIVIEEPYVTTNGIKFVRKVAPATQKYLNDFNNDLLVNKINLGNADAKIYAKDNKFKAEIYNLEAMNKIFRNL
jgi:hypothetical protein